jgi:hypothetical protein
MNLIRRGRIENVPFQPDFAGGAQRMVAHCPENKHANFGLRKAYEINFAL